MYRKRCLIIILSASDGLKKNVRPAQKLDSGQFVFSKYFMNKYEQTNVFIFKAILTS